MELTWEELKGAMVDHEVASKVCGVSRKKIGLERTKWWNDDVQKSGIAAIKVAYRRMLEAEMNEARQR